MPKTQTLDELFNDTEARLRAEHQEREARLKAEWDAKTPEEQQAYLDEQTARLAALYEGADDEDRDCQFCGNAESQCDCDDDELDEAARAAGWDDEDPHVPVECEQCGAPIDDTNAMEGDLCGDCEEEEQELAHKAFHGDD